MAQPTFAQYRANSQPILNSSGGVVLPAQTVKERQLACLAAWASQQNPDGTAI
jgi:hypothetical protein